MTPNGILAAGLAELAARAEAGEAQPELAAELRRVSDLAGGLEIYASRCTSPESEELAALAARTRAQDWEIGDDGAGLAALEQEMLSGHVEGKLLAFLIRLSGARHALDIGMFTGYSALAMAEALPEDGYVVTCEIDPGVAAIAEAAFAESPAGRRIAVELGPALTTLERLAAGGERFDLVLLDADKGGYGDYLQTLLDTDLLVPGGLLCVDNTLMQGEPWSASERTPNGEAIAGFNETVAADPRLEQVLLSVRDGITLIRRA